MSSLAARCQNDAASAAWFFGFCGLSGVAGDDFLVIDKHLIEGAERRF